MDSLRHAFSKSRSSSSASTAAKPRDSLLIIDGNTSTTSTKGGQLHDRGGSVSSLKRDSGIIGRSILSTAFGSPNGKGHSRHPSGASSRSMDHSFVSNGSLNGIYI
jgi:hypothetical protein